MSNIITIMDVYITNVQDMTWLQLQIVYMIPRVCFFFVRNKPVVGCQKVLIDNSNFVLE